MPEFVYIMAAGLDTLDFQRRSSSEDCLKINV